MADPEHVDDVSPPKHIRHRQQPQSRRLTRWLFPVWWAIKWIVWEFCGLHLMCVKLWPEHEPTEYKPTTFGLWLFGLYIAFFGLVSQRYENRVDAIENRVNLMIALMGTPSKRIAVEAFPSIQAMLCPRAALSFPTLKV